MEKTVANLEEFDREAAGFAGTLMPQAESATLVTLSGELGAGKTAFVKAVARAFGILNTVNSPTFVLEKIYGIPGNAFKHLVHIDAYRFKEGSEIQHLNFNELMRDEKNLIMLEWPERVEGVLPDPTVRISLTAHPDGTRTISYA